MVQIAILTVMGLFFTVLHSPIISPEPSSQNQGQLEAVNWAHKHYRAALDALLPFKSGKNVGDEVEWQLIIRITPPWEPESLLQVTRQWDAKTEVTYTRAEGQSILSWLEVLHARNRSAGIAEIIRQIITRKRIITGDECAPLFQHIERINQVPISIPPSSDLVMDPIRFEISCQTRSNSVNLVLTDPQHPLGIWIEELLLKLKTSCTPEAVIKKSNRTPRSCSRTALPPTPGTTTGTS
jgi:hypothetical protein